MVRILLVGFLIFTAGCATVPRSTVVVPVETTLEGLCSKYALDCSWDGVAQTVSMDYGGQRIQALVGSSLVMVGKNKLSLSAPIKRHRGAVVVPPDFEKLVFGPADQKTAAGGGSFLGRRLGKVVVDAGHGGKDPGAIGFGRLKEKDVNLDIASRVARNLKEAGVDVIQTRSDDDFIALAERTAAASRPGVDLFISIHSNATKSRRASGIEVYYVGPLNLEDKCEVQRLQNERKLCGLLNMRKDSSDLKGVVTDMLYTYKVADAPRLAEAVARGLSQAVGQVSRGSKAARYYVLRNTLVPAVLVEVGFISNPKEAAQLKEGAYRQKIADAITKSLMRYVYAQGI
jgi:N-acetylmuramoyl-L-alanine amidase